ncbi:unnamed protein product [Ceutorhynchus assimilis]|uniref:Secreted protein n=1 Tax=Ceutorhynchus assimilis TaxID=467358 RepID=A0A9P0GSD8_9CUCU|nr:unnamed protein product [Ceutorhynchus assimilis]
MARILLVLSLTAIYIGWVLTVQSCYECFGDEISGKEPCEVENTNKSTCIDGNVAKACYTVAYESEGNMTYLRSCSDLDKNMICEYYKNISSYTVKQCNACDQDNCNDDKFEM